MFRTKKETLKATYTASKAQASIGEAVSGISESMTDAGMTLQRAQDKIQQMQARSGAIDELLDSGALPDMTGTGGDDIQRQLDAVGKQGQVDSELAAIKAELAAQSSGAALPSAGETTGTPAEATTAAPAAAEGAEQS
jgi:phage shock protein A